jgi:flagellar assembly factor FliW
MKKSVDFSKEPAMSIGKDSHCVLKTVKQENLFTFPKGILGFEDIHEYVFLLNEKVEPFIFMQALGKSALCFVCIETFILDENYELQLSDAQTKELGLERPEDALVLSLVTVKKKVEDITANLMSPIVINLKTCKAQQIIQENSNYPVQFKIWESLKDISQIFNNVG